MKRAARAQRRLPWQKPRPRSRRALPHEADACGGARPAHHLACVALQPLLHQARHVVLRVQAGVVGHRLGAVEQACGVRSTGSNSCRTGRVPGQAWPQRGRPASMWAPPCSPAKSAWRMAQTLNRPHARLGRHRMLTQAKQHDHGVQQPQQGDQGGGQHAAAHAEAGRRHGTRQQDQQPKQHCSVGGAVWARHASTLAGRVETRGASTCLQCSPQVHLPGQALPASKGRGPARCTHPRSRRSATCPADWWSTPRCALCCRWPAAQGQLARGSSDSHPQARQPGFLAVQTGPRCTRNRPGHSTQATTEHLHRPAAPAMPAARRRPLPGAPHPAPAARLR